MTTPRDDIELSERLREEAARLSYRSLNHGCATCGVATNLADEAATHLDVLSARVKELEAECFRLAADTCHAGYGDEYGHHRCREVDEAESRATRAEQERDEAYERAALQAEQFAPSHSIDPGKCHGAWRIAAAIRRLVAGDEEGK